MSNTGVFGLSGYNDKNLEGLIPDKTREAFGEYGYFSGAGNGGTTGKSSVERVDYSNDTVNANFRGPLTANNYVGGTGNSFYAWVGGGGNNTRIERIDYANDNVIASIRGPLSQPRRTFGAAGNSNFGWFGGGNTAFTFPNTSGVERIDYANDLVNATKRTNLSAAISVLTSTGNSNFGYFGGGTPGPGPATVSTVERLEYSNDTTNLSIRGPLSLARRYGAATGNSNFGYFGGGESPRFSTVDRINYSNDTTTASVRGPLVFARTYINSATGNSNFGYFGGGTDASPANQNSFIDRIDYSSDTVIASVRGSFNTPRSSVAATSSHSFGGSPISQYGVFAKPFGYFGGGWIPGVTSRVDRIDYSNDTSLSRVRGSLSAGGTYIGGTGNSNFGYFGGGQLGPYRSTVDRIDYSNDSATASIRGPLSLPRAYLTSAGNSNFGYFIGGWVPSATARVDRIDYANDNTTASVRGSLSSARVSLAAAGTSNFSWIAGANQVNAVSSIVDRISYSNDTATSLTRGNMSFAKYYPLATGNSNFGYFGGGVIPSSPAVSSSTIDRIDYSNDTATASVRGPLSTQRGRGSATGTQNFGYFAGSGLETPLLSSIDRIDYSNDTATASVRGPLSTERYGMGGTSPTAFGGATDFTPTQQFFDIQSMRRIEDTTNESVKKRVLGSFGYFGGGITTFSTVDRIDYSNDTQTASVRGPLSFGRHASAATSTSNFGYFIGGFFGAFYSSFDRVDYSNDSATASVRGNLISGNSSISGVGNKNFGYCNSYGPSTIHRINYSNDTSTASVRGPLSLGRFDAAATGNNNFGYFGGGSPGPYRSTVDRIDYSNDSATASVRGPLSLARNALAATGNSNFGYYGGGSPGPVSTVYRIDYSNDTATASVRGPLSQVRQKFSATGNSNFGYFGGGRNPSVPAEYSTVDRIDYSNDNATASVRGPLSLSISYRTSTTNAANS